MSQARVERSARVALSPVPGGVGERDACDVNIGVSLRVLGGDVGAIGRCRLVWGGSTRIDSRDVPAGSGVQPGPLTGFRYPAEGHGEPSSTAMLLTRQVTQGPDGLIHQPGRSP
jgi:hypothetical protein